MQPCLPLLAVAFGDPLADAFRIGPWPAPRVGRGRWLCLSTPSDTVRVDLRARVGWQPSVASLYLDRLATVSEQLLAALAAGGSATPGGPVHEALRVSRIRQALRASASPLNEGCTRHTPATGEEL